MRKLFAFNMITFDGFFEGTNDEFRIIVNPVVLGKGTPLFQKVVEPVRLKLLKTRTFDNGNVLLYYQPAR